MIRRLRRLVARTRTAPSRIDALEQQQADLADRLTRLERRVTDLVDSDVPALFLTTEATLDGRLRAMAAEANVAAIATAQRHAEAATAHAQTTAIDAARAHAEAAALATQQTSQLHAEQLVGEHRAHIERELAAIRRELTSARRADRSSAATATPSGAPAPAAPVVDAAFYVALEDRFRGDPEVIAERQQAYVPLVDSLADAEHPLLDLGCGRGEWLRVLAAAGVPAIGVDSNPAFVGEVRDAGSTIVEGDLVEHLRSAASGSAGAITMFQVVEHLPLPVLLDVLAECVRVLRPGGVLIAETPNSLNLRVAATTFWLDPTHQTPLHPDLLKFMAQQAGFAKIDGWFMNVLNPADPAVVDPQVARLVEMVDGPGDFALIAWT